MAYFIKIANETYPSTTASNERFANFDFSPKASGETMVVFKGLMSLVSPIGADPIKSAVKVYRDNDGSTSARMWCQKAMHYVKSVEISKKFTSINNNIIFPACYTTTIEKVSTFNRPLKMSNNHSRKIRKGEPVIFENYINGSFQSFVKNDGTIEDGCPEQLEAFCHYVYHESQGQLLITGLKGVENDHRFYLTAPKIHSKERKFGSEDCGKEAIFKFFLKHVCKENCKSEWLNPLASPPVLDLGRITQIMSSNQHPGSATPPPTYLTVLQLVSGNQCYRFRTGSNSIVILPDQTCERHQSENEMEETENKDDVFVFSLQNG